MTFVFEIQDVTGRKIHLSTERWKHIQQHPEMTNKCEEIEETLISPDVITDFKYDEQVHFYYKYDKIRREYLFVSVKYLNGKGFIITSFYVDCIK